MKVAVFHSAPPGGATRVIIEYGKALIAAGHTLVCYAPGRWASHYRPLIEAGASMRYFKAPENHLMPSRGPYFVRMILGCLSYRWKALFYALECRRLAGEIDRDGYDVVWVEKCCFLSSSYILRYLKTTTVYYCQEPWRDGYERGPAEPSPKSLWGRLGYLAQEHRFNFQLCEDRQNARSANYLLANSNYSRQYIRDAYGLESEVCYLGVDPDQFRPQRLPRERFSLSVGRIEKRKRHELVVQAMGLLPPEKRLRVVIVATWDSPGRRSKLERMAAESGVEIEFRFAITDEELLDLMNRATLVFYGAIREPFGLVAIESMATGTPIVGVREGGLQESILDGETGYLSEPQPQDCARAMEKVIDDPAHARRLGENGIRIVRERWTWEASGRRFEEYLARYSKEKR